MIKLLVNTAGLVLATAGGGLLWHFVVQPLHVNVREILCGEGVTLTIPDNTPEYRAKLKRDLNWSRIGVTLTVLGGMLQIWSNFLPD